MDLSLGANTAAFNIEDLARPGTYPDPRRCAFVGPTDFIHRPAQCVRGGRLPAGESLYVGGERMGGMNSARARLLGFSYALVLKQRSFTPPTRLPDGKTFAPGRLEADVLVFRISDQALLGGVRVDVSNSSKVEFRVSFDENSTDKGTAAILVDLGQQAIEAALGAIRAQAD